jgi:hypothetical protein
MAHGLTPYYIYVLGAATFGAWACGLHFLKFWRKSGDRFFLFFGASFWLLALERLVLALLERPSREDQSLIYLMRLGAFLLILYAIADKNRQDRKSPR